MQENRLVRAMGAKQATLTYDPMGRLWQVDGTAAGGTITRFLYDGDALVAEYDAPGNLTDRYVHGVGADVPTQWYEGSAVNSSTRHHLFANWQGSIALITNTTGNTVNINAYDAYGIANETNIGRFQYTGQITIPELGLYHYKARVYSPTLGRFLQTDPIGYDDGLNIYAYVGNDPVNLIDPTGLSRLGNESNLRGFSVVNNMIAAGNSPFEQGSSQAVGPSHANSESGESDYGSGASGENYSEEAVSAEQLSDLRRQVSIACGTYGSSSSECEAAKEDYRLAWNQRTRETQSVGKGRLPEKPHWVYGSLKQAGTGLGYAGCVFGVASAETGVGLALAWVACGSAATSALPSE